MIDRNINNDETKKKGMDRNNKPSEDGRNEKVPESDEKERNIVARLRNFPKSRRKSVMEKSRKIAATRLTPNASQELNRFESHNPQRDFNEERFLQGRIWKHEELRSSKDDDSVYDYLIIPDRDRVI
jgi:hypothetical protein